MNRVLEEGRDGFAKQLMLHKGKRDVWERVADRYAWVRYHGAPRRQKYQPEEKSGGPDLEQLSDIRYTFKTLPGGESVVDRDKWRNRVDASEQYP